MSFLFSLLIYLLCCQLFPLLLWPAADGKAWTCHPPHSPGPTPPLKVTKSGRKRQGEIPEHIIPTEQQKSKHSVLTERTVGYFKSTGIFHGKERQNVPELYKCLLALSPCTQSPKNGPQAVSTAICSATWLPRSRAGSAKWSISWKLAHHTRCSIPFDFRDCNMPSILAISVLTEGIPTPGHQKHYLE